MKTAHVHDIGLIEYRKAWDFQENLFNKILDIKSKSRNEDKNLKTENHLIANILMSIL